MESSICCATAVGVAVGLSSKRRATAPATKGVAIDVPDNNAHSLVELAPVPATGLVRLEATNGHADLM